MDEFSLKKSTSSFETLSNEIFYEIFDYFDGFQLNETFSNLNVRFENLLNAVRFRFQLDLFDSITTNHSGFNRLVIPYKHRTFSLIIDGFWNDFETFPDLVFDSTFSCLESLQMNEIPSNDILNILKDLKNLPRLKSLTISYLYDFGTINDVYRLIFSFPKLKFNKLSIQFCQTIDPLAKAMPNQYTLIEHLVIRHSCTENQLLALISYAPHLRRLYCKNFIFKQRK